MSDNSLPLLPLPIFAGRVEKASYRGQPIPDYCNNPLIEALPPIWTADAAVRLLGHYPEYDEQHRALPPELRFHLIQNSVRFFEPLPIHLNLEQRFSRILRAGYLARNPIQREFWRNVHQNVQSLRQDEMAKDQARSTAVGFTMVGISGVGKSTAVEAILSLYPQVIYHSNYRDRLFNWVQITWLKLDCPFDGSTKGLCLNFFQAIDSLLDTHYYRSYARRGRSTTDEMIPYMARVGSIHSLGVLVIDEIQNLSEARSGGARRMLNFFVQLVNTTGMPVVLVGTYKALSSLTGEFRQARRGSGQGDLVWDRMSEDDVWQLFVESLWRYQYVRNPTALTPELSHALYDVSQGITDFAVKAYLLAQIRAIASGKESVTGNVIRSVAADSFRLANPVLSALRREDRQALLHIEDVHPVGLDAYLQSALQVPQAAEHSETSHQTNVEPAGEETDPVSESGSEQQRSLSSTSEPKQDGKGDIGQAHESTKHDRCVVPAEMQLQEIVQKGERREAAAYEALRQAGYICHANEFLEASAVQ
jgi:hypothetical protein